MPDVYEVKGPDGHTYEVRANSAAEAAAAFDKPPEQQAPSFDSPEARAMTQQNAQKQSGMLPDEAEYTGQAIAERAQGAKNTGAGVMEGGRLLRAGGQQLMAGVQDAYNAFVKGVAPRSEGIRVNADTGARERVHELRPNSASLGVIANETLRAQVQAEEDKARGVNIGARDVAAGATQIGALTLGPELALPKATTITGAALKNSVAGQIGAAGSFDASGGRLRDIGVAAVAGPVLGLIPSLAPAVKNYVGRALARVSKGTRSAAALDSASQTLPNVTYSLAQRTGIPELKTLERASYDSKSVDFFADQTDKFVTDTVNALKQPMKDGQNLADDFVAARTKADGALTNLKRTASSNYERGVAAAESMTPGYVQVDNLRDAFTPILKQSRDVLASGGRVIMPENFMKELGKTLFNPKGAPRVMSSNELARAMKGLTALQKSEDPVQRALASKLREGLDADLDHVQDVIAKGGPADKAIKQLLETRAEYRRAMQAADTLGNSASYKLLGVGESEAGSDELLSKLKAMSPEKRDSVRKFMEQNSPDLLVSMKDAAVKDVAKRAGTIREAADSQQSLDQLMDGMFDAKNGYDMRTSGVWSAEELKRIEGIKNGLRTVANNRPSLGGSGTPVKPEDIAINLVARHSAFMARQLTRVLMGTKGSQFFTDPRVYERMTKISRSTTGSATNMLARASLLDLLQTDYSEAQPQE